MQHPYELFGRYVAEMVDEEFHELKEFLLNLLGLGPDLLCGLAQCMLVLKQDSQVTAGSSRPNFYSGP